MATESYPSLEEFLSAPLAEVAAVAPTTMIYAPGGTRRSAVFHGIEPWSDAYVRWAQAKSMLCIDLIFQHGVRYLLTPALTPGNLREVNQYSKQVFQMADWVLAGPESLAAYAENRWRVRLIGDIHLPELKKTAEKLERDTPAHADHLLCWTVVTETEAPWQRLLATLKDQSIETAADAIHRLYGEQIPPATLYLAFGKPTVDFGIVPPLLLGDLQCYWTQQPGYSLDQKQLRTILYDYAYLRRTWREEKLERAKAGLSHRKAWEEGPVLGLGQRLGPFWYPAATAAVANREGDYTTNNL